MIESTTQPPDADGATIRRTVRTDRFSSMSEML